MACRWLDLVLTGGIATGKSTFLALLRQALPALGVFDCDKAVHQLLTEAATAGNLRRSLGPSILQPDGSINRSELGRLVFSNPSFRKQVEEVLHPLVAERCTLARIAFHDQHPNQPFVADVPLYFESQHRQRYPADRVIVVATTEATQSHRLKERSGLREQEAAARLAAQMPILGKMRAADQVIWNEGPLELLREQAIAFSCFLCPTL